MDNMTPEELANALDKALPSGSQVRLASSGSTSDPLVQAAVTLAKTPRPTLSADAKDRIAARMFAALDAMPQPAQAKPTTPKPLPNHTSKIVRFMPVFAGISAAAAALVIAIFGILPLLTPATGTPTGPAVAYLDPTATVTEAVTETDTPAVIETATDTNTPTIPTDSAPTETDTPTVPTAELPTDSAPTSIPLYSTATLPPVVVSNEALFIIEGQVEEVLENGVVIAGFAVQMDTPPALLNVLRRGDTIRIEGTFSAKQTSAGSSSGFELVLSLNDATIELDNDNPAENVVEVGPDGTVWRDNGSCDNPPPTWASGGGWRQRCGTAGGGSSTTNPGGSQTGAGNNNGGGQGQGNNPGQGQGNNNSGGQGQGQGNNNGSGQGQGGGKP
jgi:hypothetical protein